MERRKRECTLLDGQADPAFRAVTRLQAGLGRQHCLNHLHLLHAEDTARATTILAVAMVQAPHVVSAMAPAVAVRAQ
jgi:hypothetical protein